MNECTVITEIDCQYYSFAGHKFQTCVISEFSCISCDAASFPPMLTIFGTDFAFVIL
jgi:hypothetical protein